MLHPEVGDMCPAAATRSIDNAAPAWREKAPAARGRALRALGPRYVKVRRERGATGGGPDVHVDGPDRADRASQYLLDEVKRVMPPAGSSRR